MEPVSPSTPFLDKLPTWKQTLAHAAFPSAIWALQPDKKGATAVAHSRGGPFDIAWEIHGSGPIKLLFVSPIDSAATVWQQQTCFFGHDQGEARAQDGKRKVVGEKADDETAENENAEDMTAEDGKSKADVYSVLIMENRGVGYSGRPLMRYSMSEMARDTLEVLDAVGWTGRRQVHVIGHSMGGMIAQEMACVAPQRLASMSLISTSARLPKNLSALVSIAKLIPLLLARPPTHRKFIARVSMFVSDAWMLAPDEQLLPSPASTPACGTPPGAAQRHDTPSSAEYRHFDSRFQWYQAHELAVHGNPAIPPHRTLCQAVAIFFHSKTDAQLRAMADAVGRHRILVMHGVEDTLLSVDQGRRLVRALEPAHAFIVDGVAHVPIIERPQWFNKVLQEKIAIWANL